MTLAYGLAQVIAPAITGVIAEKTGSYTTGLYLAAMLLGCGVLVLYCLSQTDQTAKQLG